MVRIFVGIRNHPLTKLFHNHYLVAPDFIEDIKVFENDVNDDQEHQTQHDGDDDVVVV